MNTPRAIFGVLFFVYENVFSSINHKSSPYGLGHEQIFHSIGEKKIGLLSKRVDPEQLAIIDVRATYAKSFIM
jgi:hypothetical protein